MLLCGRKFSNQLVKYLGAGLLDKTIFSFVKNCQTLFQHDSTPLHSHKQWMKVSFPLYPCQQLVLTLWQEGLRVSYANRGLKMSFSMASDVFLKCISQMANDVKYHFICSFTISYLFCWGIICSDLFCLLSSCWVL